MTPTDQHKYKIEYLLDGVRRSITGKGTSSEDIKGKVMLYLLDKYPGKLEIVSVRPVSETQMSHPQQIVYQVIHYGAVRVDRETKEEANDLALAVENEFKKQGVSDCYWCWVMGTSVHVFPVFYEMEGSLNYLERIGKLAQKDQHEQQDRFVNNK